FARYPLLPSSPTRRSSDLLNSGTHHGVALLVVGFALGFGRSSRDDRDHSGELLWSHDRRFGVRPAEHEPRIVCASAHPVIARPVDRKSTRLNSSHVSSSYA